MTMREFPPAHYPTLRIARLARNHPLPDGDKRTGIFLEANGMPLRGTKPDVDVPMVKRIASGQVDHAQIVA